jgi:hypothetical protein
VYVDQWNVTVFDDAHGNMKRASDVKDDKRQPYSNSVSDLLLYFDISSYFFNNKIKCRVLDFCNSY